MVRRTKPPSQTRQAYLENHVTTMALVDFFTVPTIRFQAPYPPHGSGNTVNGNLPGLSSRPARGELRLSSMTLFPYSAHCTQGNS